MKDRLKNGIAWALLPQILVVKLLGSYPDFVEQYYSNGAYPVISKFFRFLLGWIPFSIGDIIYFVIICLSIGYLFYHRKYIKKHPKLFIRNIVMVLSVAYFTFHISWAFNYYRLPISNKLQLEETYTKDELVSFTKNLINKTNQLHLTITNDSTLKVDFPYTKNEIFEKTISGYKNLGTTFPFLSYQKPSIKKSVFSTVLSYMGYGGYLNPFTHESQVNGKLPNFRFPVVSGHEIGHQLGYSAENETNLIGYIVTINNKDVLFQYSGYAYALGYCLSNIKAVDKKLYGELIILVNAGILKNFQEVNDFWKSYENPMEPIFKSIYNTFLKVNNQKEGIKSYSSVVGLFVTYHKKYPL